MTYSIPPQRDPRKGSDYDEVAGNDLLRSTLQPTRYRILRTSGELFARWGYHGTSTRQIAAGVGISQPSLFHHFKVKQEIMEDLLGINYLPPLNLLRKLNGYPASASAKMWAATVLDVLYCTRIGIDLAGTHNDDVLTDPDFMLWSGVRDDYAGCVATIITQGVQSGEFADIDPRISLLMHTGMTKELIRLVGRRGLPKGEEWADHLAEMMVRALSRDRLAAAKVRSEAAGVVEEFNYHADVQPGEIPRILASMKAAMGLA